MFYCQALVQVLIPRPNRSQGRTLNPDHVLKIQKPNSLD